MCEVPRTSPHDRRVKPVEEDEGEDLVDKLIRDSGCEKEHYLVQECMVDHQDWRKCQDALKTFQACLNSKKQSRV